MNIVKRMVRRAWRGYRDRRADPAVNPGCGEFEVDNWLISEFVLRKLVPAVGVHPYPLPELHLMAAAVCRLKPGVIFEWGTHLGASARVFYETARRFRIEIPIHSIDLPPDVDHGEHPRSQRGRLVKGRPGVMLHLGDGLDKAAELYRALPRGRPPLVFIDGDHAYPSVRRELEGVMTEMPEAHILLHDTFYQSPEAGYNLGPYRAIQDVLASRPHDYRMLAAATGLPGMTLLYRP